MYQEKFTINPAELIPFKQTTVSPMYAEEWHVRPPSYDLYTNSPPPIDPNINKVEDPRDYPYGQYLTITNLIPRDEKVVNLLCNSKAKAIDYINSTFTAQDILFRDNISRIQKKKLARRFRQECNDTFSPYNSF